MAGIVLGVAGATSHRGPIFTAGLAGVVAGAMSMALGEYVSVSSQRDSEQAQLAKERIELRTAPQEELAELTALYEAPASEAHCNFVTGAHCVVPPHGPGHFYPYYTLAKVAGTCVWEFGNMSNGRTFGKDSQYGTFIRESLRGPIITNPTTC